MRWTVETLNKTVDDELRVLPTELRARFARISELIAAVGLDRVGSPHVKHVSGALWEIRMTGRGTIARALYVTARERRAIVVRVFVKKTRRTPKREIELALRRAREVLE